MRSPPIRRRPIGGQRSRCPDRIALVDPRKRGPSPFASCGHLRYVGDPSAGSALGAPTPLRRSLPLKGAPPPSLHGVTSHSSETPRPPAECHRPPPPARRSPPTARAPPLLLPPPPP